MLGTLFGDSKKLLQLLCLLSVFLRLSGTLQASEPKTSGESPWKWSFIGFEGIEDKEWNGNPTQNVPAGSEFLPYRDEIAFLYKRLASEGQVTAFLSSEFQGVKRGILVRSSLLPDAATLFAGMGSNGVLAVFSRSQNGGVGIVQEHPELGTGWTAFRLTRQGSLVQIFASRDRLHWTPFASGQWNPEVAIYAGVGTVSNVPSSLEISSLEMVDIPLSKLVLWLRADSGVVLDKAGKVREWINQVNGQSALQSDPNLRPELQIAADEKPVVWFDGADDTMQVPLDMASAVNPQMTAVFAVDTKGNKRPEGMDLWNFGNGSGTKLFTDQKQIQDDFALESPQRTILPKLDQWLNYSSGIQGQVWNNYLDGNLLKTLPVSGVAVFSKKLLLGQGGFNGGIREFLVFKDGLSTQEKSQLSSYIGALQSKERADAVGATPPQEPVANSAALVQVPSTRSEPEVTSEAESNMLYVDNRTGDDANSGKFSSPKHSLQSAFSLLSTKGGTITVQGSDLPYDLNTESLPDNVTFVPVGNITINSK